METRNHGFSLRTSIRAWWYFVALGCFSLTAHAQSDFGEKIWWKADAGQWVPNYNKSSAFQGTTATPFSGSGALVVNGAGVVHGPAEWPKARATAPIPGLNKSAPIDVVARFKPVSVGAAVGRLATKLGPISSAVALVTFAAEVGFILTDGPGGETVIQKQTQPPAGYDGREWSVPNINGGTWYETRQAACEGSAYFRSISGFPYDPTTWKCRNAFSQVSPPWMQHEHKNGGQISDWQMQFRTDPTPFVPTQVAATSTELADKIASESGWPSSSSVAPAIVEALKRGERIETEAGVVSGPASSPVSTVTINNPNGSTTTKTTTNNYTYNGPNVKVTTTTITQNFNPSTGLTETTTETTEEEPEPTPPEEEQNQCELTPDALGCAELDTPTEEIPRDTETITYEEESVFGSGSCPSNLTASIATLGSSVTVWDWSKTCELALPLRALVVGLASFAALLIVMPGGNKS